MRISHGHLLITKLEYSCWNFVYSMNALRNFVFIWWYTCWMWQGDDDDGSDDEKRSNKHHHRHHRKSYDDEWLLCRLPCEWDSCPNELLNKGWHDWLPFESFKWCGTGASLEYLNSKTVWLCINSIMSLCVLLNKVPDIWAGVFNHSFLLSACEVTCLWVSRFYRLGLLFGWRVNGLVTGQCLILTAF